MINVFGSEEIKAERLTGDPGDEFERSQHSHGPQGSKVDWDVHVRPGSGQDPDGQHAHHVQHSIRLGHHSQ